MDEIYIEANVTNLQMHTEGVVVTAKYWQGGNDGREIEFLVRDSNAPAIRDRLVITIKKR
jgi:hypothetical protein